MQKLMSGLGLIGTALSLISVASFAIYIAADWGILALESAWAFWYLGLASAVLAMLAVAGWGACCGVSYWIEHRPAGPGR